MNSRALGIILIIVALVVATGTYLAKQTAERTITEVVNNTGSCFLEDGTCLHSTANTYYVIGWVIAGILAAFGLYLIFIRREQRELEKHAKHVEEAVSEVHKVKEDITKKTEKDEFDVFLSAFEKKEQLLLKAIKEQDGILQSTLRYRVGMSKSALSQKLTEFEKKGIIARKEKGTTNQVFLRKRF